MTPRTIIAWPPRVAAPFDDLYDTLADLLPEHAVSAGAELADITSTLAAQPPEAVVVVLDPVATAGVGVDALTALLAALAEQPAVSIAVVASDGYLGADTAIATPSGQAALLAAVAVSGTRSLALTRGRPGRSNVVCVPHAAFGATSALRGPIAQPTETVDVANALAFLLDDSGRYVSGDVVFVDGGRHLFSSHTA